MTNQELIERPRWDELVRRLQEAEVTTRWLNWHHDEKQQARLKKVASINGPLTSIESQLVWALTEPDLRTIIADALTGSPPASAEASPGLRPVETRSLEEAEAVPAVSISSATLDWRDRMPG